MSTCRGKIFFEWLLARKGICTTNESGRALDDEKMRKLIHDKAMFPPLSTWLLVWASWNRFKNWFEVRNDRVDNGNDVV